jgi:predicted phage terminase large subunit-like protein
MYFLLLDALEVLYGGATAGGKSDALLMAAAMYINVPGYSAIIFRRTISDLELSGGLIPRSKSWGWAEKGAKWNGSTYTWTFPRGSTISFGYLNHDQAHLRYKSSEYQFIGIDQAEDITKAAYTYLFSRLRRLEGAEVPLRMRATANPGGEPWVYLRFVNENTRLKESVFVPATLDDNPYIDKTEYEESMSKLDPITYQQLRHGVWGLQAPGALFNTADFQLIQRLPFDKPLRGVRYWDTAGTDELEIDEGTGSKQAAWTAGVLLLQDTQGRIYVADVVRRRVAPLKAEQLIRNTAILDNQYVKDLKVSHISTWMEQEPGDAGQFVIQHYAQRVMQGFDFRGDKVTGNKVDRSRPWSSIVASRAVSLITGTEKGQGAWIDDYLLEHQAFPDGTYKDQVDASAGAYQKIIDVSRPAKAGFI